MPALSDDLILTSPTTLKYQGKVYECRTGKGGIRLHKLEGDGATPAGTFPLRKVLYRPDRVRPFTSALPMAPMTSLDGWCDDPADPLYNRLVKIPYPGRHEILWREDSVYDIIIVVGYNDYPPAPSKGSAIFIHLMNEERTPTEGCIALHRKDLIEIVQEAGPATGLRVPDHLDSDFSSSGA